LRDAAAGSSRGFFFAYHHENANDG
jgi:hypothetical protein